MFVCILQPLIFCCSAPEQNMAWLSMQYPFPPSILSAKFVMVGALSQTGINFRSSWDTLEYFIPRQDAERDKDFQSSLRGSGCFRSCCPQSRTVLSSIRMCCSLPPSQFLSPTTSDFSFFPLHFSLIIPASCCSSHTQLLYKMFDTFGHCHLAVSFFTKADQSQSS